MNLNYYAFFLISFIPLIIGFFWYHLQSFVSKWSGEKFKNIKKLSFIQVITCFVLSFTLVYGYINIVIHQIRFYELFFTDIMKGSQEAEVVVKEFLSKYGNKHRHFGHGVFHGIINAFVFALPFIGFHAILGQKNKSYVAHHFSYWLITSAVIGGLISEFV